MGYTISTRPQEMNNAAGHWWEVRDEGGKLRTEGWTRGAKSNAEQEARAAVVRLLDGVQHA